MTGATTIAYGFWSPLAGTVEVSQAVAVDRLEEALLLRPRMRGRIAMGAGERTAGQRRGRTR